MKIFRSVMNAFWGVKNADPAVMPAGTVLSMATGNGGELLGEKGSLGFLKKGACADLISIDFYQPHLYPTGNPVNTLLECVTAADVSDSMVNGRFLMRDREVLTLDEETDPVGRQGLLQKGEQGFKARRQVLVLVIKRPAYHFLRRAPGSGWDGECLFLFPPLPAFPGAR